MANLSLVLSPDFGGGSFGPYPPGPVGLGCDAAQCHVALNPNLGLHPVHVWVAADERGQWWLQPVDPSAVVHHFPAGRSPGRPLSTAVRLSQGDAFALGGPQGPRFAVEIEVSRPQSPRSRNQLPTGDAMAREVQRQLSTQAMRYGPFAEIVGLMYRAKSGSLFQPRYLVGAAIALAGAAFTACAGAGALLGLR